MLQDNRKPEDILFFLSFGLYMTVQLLTTTFYNRFIPGKLYVLLLLFCAVLLVIREFLIDELPVNRLPMILLCAMLAMIIMKDAPRKYEVFFVPYIYAVRNLPLKKVAKFSAILSAVVLLLVSASSLVGIIENHQDLFNGRPRNYLGFRYPLFPATVLFNIIALAVYEKGEKISGWLLCFLAVANYGIYRLTDSRLCCYTGWIVILIAILLKFRPDFFEHLTVLNWGMILSFPICFLVSIILSYRFVPFGQLRVLNDILGNRLNLGNASIKKYGFSLLGRRIHWVGNGLNAYGQHSTEKYSYVDCMYLQVLQRYGVIFSVIMLVLMSILMYRLYKKKCWHLLVIFTVIAFHGMIDDLLFYLHYCTFWLALGSFFSGKVCLVISGQTEPEPG